MNHAELAVLDAVNIATAIYRRKGHNFEATAAQIAEVLNADERIQKEFPVQMTTAQVGVELRALAGHRLFRFVPLVEKVDSRRWRLTAFGCKAMGA